MTKRAGTVGLRLARFVRAEVLILPRTGAHAY